MKLISLNIWGGKVYDPLMQFIKESSRDTDIFCFQEVFRTSSGIAESHGARMNILADISATLPEHVAYFAPSVNGFDLVGPVDFDAQQGQATFVRNSIPVDSWGSFFVCGEENVLPEDGDPCKTPENMLYFRLSRGNKKFMVCNLHGVAFPGSKLDTEERLEQSRRVKQFLDKERGTKILCGDFNLMPETESLKMLDRDMVDLVKTFKIPRTRSKLSPFWGKKDFYGFADYVLVSKEIEVRSFSVPDLGVSDHLPLVLEFS